MLLNKHQKEQFKLDYPKMRMLDLTIKYGASDKKVTELALSMGLGLKRAGRIIGSMGKI
jgi:hypothetical protein